MKNTLSIFIFGAIAAVFSFPVCGQEINRGIDPVDVSVGTDLSRKATEVSPTPPVKHPKPFASWSAPSAKRIPPISLWTRKPEHIEIDSDTMPPTPWMKFGSTALPGKKLLDPFTDQFHQEKQTPRSEVLKSADHPSPAQSGLAFPQTRSLVFNPAFKKSPFELLDPSFLRKPYSSKIRTSTNQTKPNEQRRTTKVGTTP
jgi:hypothetical protein